MHSNRHPSRAAALATAVALVALVAGCLGSGGPTPSPLDSGAATTGSGLPSAEPTPAETSQPATLDPGTASETPPGASDAPPESASPESSSPSSGSAADCSGNDNNRDFFADAAAALDFDVYCASLPRGWFLDSGEYSLRNGGSLSITYQGPGDAVLELREAGPCQPGDDCIPSGTEEGDASFGDRQGVLVALDDGRLMVVAEDGQEGHWWLTATGLDDGELREIAADLVRVGG